MDKELLKIMCSIRNSAEAVCLGWNLKVDQRRPRNIEDAMALAAEVAEGSPLRAVVGRNDMPAWVNDDGKIVAEVWQSGTAMPLPVE